MTINPTSQYIIRRMFDSALACLVLMGCVLSVGVDPAVARQMSSKRECAICHVMWAEAFRSNQETLIPWQGGNVLMKDTQGVVSAEDNCYSCHDGYVSDSRATAWKGGNHPTMVTPSQKVSVPEKMPLSNKGQVYCGTCHTPHAGSQAPGEVPLQPSSFLRVEYTTSQLCALCHGDKADYRRSHSHPLVKMKQPIPQTLTAMGSKSGPDQRTLVCQTCHRVHGAKGDKIAVAADTSALLCTACHTRQSAIVGSQHDLRRVKARSETTEPMKWGTCGGCHTPHDAKAERLWKHSVQGGNPATQMCMRCHSTDGAYPAKGIGAHSHPVNQRPKSTKGLKLPLYAQSGQPTGEGRVQCFTCHDVHRWSPDGRRPDSGADQEGDGSNSFLRMETAASSALCRQCHGDKETVISSVHNLTHSDPNTVNSRQQTVRTSGPCGACHLTHNATGPRLWARSVAPGNPATQACLSCHANGVGKALGPNNHPKGVTLSSRGSPELPVFAPDGKVSPKGTLECSTCHDAHDWGGRRKSGPMAPNVLVEGDAANSFLRKDNSGPSGLCVACHKDQAMVRGTDHDLGQSAPQAKNALGQTARQAGYCSSCHVPHGSPYPMKMWAQPMGHVGPDEPAINQLCRGCHAKGQSAGDRVPEVASHPQGHLITTLRSAHQPADTRMVVFDSLGNRQHIGDIGCATCHDAHRRHPISKSSAVPKFASEGSGRFKFMRTMSARSLCSECHGPDGLFRYLYFHDPAKRMSGSVQPIILRKKK